MWQRVMRNPTPAGDSGGGSSKDGDGHGRDAALCHSAQIRSRAALWHCESSHCSAVRSIANSSTRIRPALTNSPNSSRRSPRAACVRKPDCAGAIGGICRNHRRGKRVSFWWTMGVNQGHEATRTAQAIINLALMTGNIGRPGTGANSITGQCNAMGSRLFANITSLLGGHDLRMTRAIAPRSRRILGIARADYPAQPSWPTTRSWRASTTARSRGCG